MLLKIALEIQDKSKSAEQADLRQDTAPLKFDRKKMQILRFRRFTDLFRIVLDIGLPELDLFHIFFGKGVATLLSPNLRKEIILKCTA